MPVAVQAEGPLPGEVSVRRHQRAELAAEESRPQVAEPSSLLEGSEQLAATVQGELCHNYCNRADRLYSCHNDASDNRLG